MRKLAVFNNISLDGYFTDRHGDMSWAHIGADDPKFRAFVAGNAKGGGELLFGRKTYELMASYWPTPMAARNDSVVAERMNALPKVVFSRTLHQAAWRNTKLVKRGLAAQVRKMKAAPGPGMVILGSGSIVAQLTQEGLIDEFQLVLNPVILGGGRTMFDGLREKPSLALQAMRRFANGKVFLSYGLAR